jgi:hypothetical protein
MDRLQGGVALQTRSQLPSFPTALYGTLWLTGSLLPLAWVYRGRQRPLARASRRLAGDPLPVEPRAIIVVLL